MYLIIIILLCLIFLALRTANLSIQDWRAKIFVGCYEPAYLHNILSGIPGGCHGFQAALVLYCQPTLLQ